MKVGSRFLVWFVPVFVAAGIGISAGAGWWVTESTKEPARFATGEYEGEANPADIRGSYTLADVSDAFEIPVEVLAEAFALPPESGDVRLGDFEETYGEIGQLEIGTDAMRLFVARYLRLPYEPEETTGLIEPGVTMLLEQTDVDEATAQDLKDRIVTLEQIAAAREDGALSGAGPETATETAEEGSGSERGVVQPVEADDEHEEEDYEVKGRTTFGEVIMWGVPVEEIKAAMGGEMGPRPMLIRDYCVEEGISFAEAKTNLQELVDQYRSDE